MRPVAKLAWAVVVAVGLYATGFATGWTVQEWRQTAAHAEVIRKLNKDASDKVDQALQRQQEASKKFDVERRDLAEQLRVQDEENRKDKDRISQLDACIHSGKCGLYVATVPAKPVACSKPGDATGAVAPSGNSGGAGRLTDSAAQSYMEFERRYGEQLNTLRKCKIYGDKMNKPRQ